MAIARCSPLPRAALAYVIVPGLILLFTWRQLQLQPVPGFDPSWNAGLDMAVSHGLVFGQQVVFTYGPLGFLSVSGLWSAGLGVLAFVYTLTLRFVLASAVFLAARRSFGAVAGFAIAVVVLSVGIYFLPELVLLLILGVQGIGSGISGRRARVACGAGGAFAAFELLNKVSIGVALAVMIVGLVVALTGRRRWLALAAAAGFLGSLLLGWIVTGQPIAALPEYLLGAARISSGWTPAVSVEQPGLSWQYPVALLGLGAGLLAAWDMTAGAPARQRLGALVMWSAFWFFAFKEGFVRHDEDHAATFFGALPLGLLAFRYRPGRRLVALLLTAGVAAIAVHAQSVSLTAALNPLGNLGHAVSDTRDVLSPSRRAAEMAAGRAQIEAVEPLDRRALSLLRDHTVAVFPSEIALAWAYELHWDPLPLLQSYNAYTTALDTLDANSLASADAPQRILFLLPPQPYLDGRVLSFDQPQTSRAIMCRYRALYRHGDLAVLGRGQNHCSPPVLIRTVPAAWGQPVAVPAPRDRHSLVSVRIDGVQIGGVESLESLLFKPHRRFIRLDGGPPHRLVTGTATDGLPLSAGPAADFKPPFNVAVGARTIAVQLGPGAPADRDAITYSFYEQSIG